jgi:hypothetical protein
MQRAMQLELKKLASAPGLGRRGRPTKRDRRKIHYFNSKDQVQSSGKKCCFYASRSTFVAVIGLPAQPKFVIVLPSAWRNQVAFSLLFHFTQGFLKCPFSPVTASHSRGFAKLTRGCVICNDCAFSSISPFLPRLFAFFFGFRFSYCFPRRSRGGFCFAFECRRRTHHRAG